MSLNKENLKVGDWIVGNKNANSLYSQTTEGWKGQVINIHNTSFDAEGKGSFNLKTRFTCLDFECFDKLYQFSAEELKEILKF